MKKQIINDFLIWLKKENLDLINKNANITVAIYIRVSTDKQEELSPLSQLKEAYKYSFKHNMQINLDYIFIEDEGVSGRKVEKREAFKDMISIAKSDSKKFSTIIVWKYSRFARNQEESIVYKSMLKKKNVDVISISEPLIAGPFGTLIERIIEWMDEYYSINLSGEVMRGMTEKANRGEPQAAPAFGYEIKNNTYIPNEIESSVVQFIFEKYSSGAMEMINIAKYLNEHNFKTKRGKKFENRTIRYILNNPIYIGKIRWTPNSKLTNEEMYSNTKSIITKGNHQPIINEELFNKAKERLSNQKKFSVKHQRISNNPYHWLKGLLRCGNCNKTFVRSNKKLRCNGYNKGSCSCSTSLDIDEIEELVLRQIKKNLKLPLNIEFVKFENKSDKNTTELKMLEKHLELSIQKLDRTKMAFESGIDTLKEYKENKKRINNEVEQLKNLIKEKNDIHEKDSNVEIKVIHENMNTIYDLLIDKNIDMKKKYDIVHFIVNKIIYDERSNSLTLFYNEMENV